MSSFPVAAFDHYFAMWNETDPSAIRSHLDRAVTGDFIFCDPLNFHAGRDALEVNVRAFHSEYPGAAISVVSGFDSHHNRHRYEWSIAVSGRHLLNGFDVATVADDELIERIDGFFGPLPRLS